jgi:NifU-like protein involved in Fe-S cluster formation
MTSTGIAQTPDKGGPALYTRELLGLAVSLAGFPLQSGADFSGQARSVTCGSRVSFSCNIDVAGAISEPGLRVSACAVGQAAAAVFVAHAAGKERRRIAEARDAIAVWLSEGGPLPGWPGLEALEPARAYPGRHGAILLAWNAALGALPKDTRES